MTAAPAIGRIVDGTSAEGVILRLCWLLLGNGTLTGKGADRGLLTRIHQGRQHVATCQVGYCVVQGDSQRGGQPCSERCQRAWETIALAEDWLRVHGIEAEPEAPSAPRPPRRRQPPVRQPSMFESEAAG